MVGRPHVRVRFVTALALVVGSVTAASVALGTDTGPGSQVALRDADSAASDPWKVEPRTTIQGGLALRTAAQRRRRIAVTSARGSHTFTASALAEHDLPSAAMRAYRHAARSIDVSQPGCHLPWTLLAGIGRVESDHGRYGGAVLGADGVSRPAIIGIALDGKGPVAAIHDTDGGRLDGDTVWDRAVGPMQFLPSTWRTAGRDGDGDGVRSPGDIDDAALAAAAYLCAGGRDVSTTAGLRAAVLSYNPSDYYVDLVSAFARGYRTGTFVIPSPPVAAEVPTAAEKAAKAAKAAKAKAAKAKAKAAEKAAKAEAAEQAAAEEEAEAKAAAQAKAAAEAKAAQPKPPVTHRSVVTGVLADGPGQSWVVAGTRFSVRQTAAVTPSDLDADGRTESLATELDGVVLRHGVVAVSVRRTGTVVVVTRVVVQSLDPLPSPTPTPTPAAPVPASPSTPASRTPAPAASSAPTSAAADPATQAPASPTAAGPTP